MGGDGLNMLEHSNYEIFSLQAELQQITKYNF
jgi:hypothetical protein